MSGSSSVPSVGEGEFAELAGWVRENEGWLSGLTGADGLVASGGGEGVSIADLVAGIGRGPRVPGAGEVAVVVRRLRARHEHVLVPAVDGGRR